LSRSSDGIAARIVAPDRAAFAVTAIPVSIAPKSELANAPTGLVEPLRCALICNSASNAAAMMMPISAKSLRSSLYVKMVSLHSVWEERILTGEARG